MLREDIPKTVMREIAGLLDISGVGLEPSTFLAEIGMDSLDVVVLTMIFEDTYYLDIPDEILGEPKTIGDLIAAVEKTYDETQKCKSS